METVHLRALQRPSQIELLLESLIADIRYLPEDVRPIVSASELPSRLQFHARRAVPNEAWRAWTDERRVWFVVGKISPTISRQIRDPALHAFFYDTEGRLAASGVWVRRPAGHWQVREVTGATTITRRLDPAVFAAAAED